jgi:hypothetical protein
VCVCVCVCVVVVVVDLRVTLKNLKTLGVALECLRGNLCRQQQRNVVRYACKVSDILVRF